MCNSTCGNGVKTRARLCNNPEPSGGGKACTGLGPVVEYQACNSFPCRMFNSSYVAGKVPTYPTPEPTFFPKWEVSVNVG